MISLVLFLVCNIVHFFTYVGINLETKWPWIWILHFAVIIVFFPAVLLYSKKDKTNHNVEFDQMKYTPKLIKTLLIIYSLYAGINFGVLFYYTKEGSPEIKDGKYYLYNHGTKVREINEKEYIIGKTRNLRGSSGHWMLFSLASLSMYLSGYNDPRFKN